MSEYIIRKNGVTSWGYDKLELLNGHNEVVDWFALNFKDKYVESALEGVYLNKFSLKWNDFKGYINLIMLYGTDEVKNIADIGVLEENFEILLAKVEGSECQYRFFRNGVQFDYFWLDHKGLRVDVFLKDSVCVKFNININSYNDYMGLISKYLVKEITPETKVYTVKVDDTNSEGCMTYNVFLNDTLIGWTTLNYRKMTFSKTLGDSTSSELGLNDFSDYVTFIKEHIVEGEDE